MIVALLAVTSTTAALIAFGRFESFSSVYGHSPDGRYTLVFIKKGPDH